MTGMRLSDISGYDPVEFRDAGVELSTQKSPLFDAGVIVQRPDIVVPAKGHTVVNANYTDLEGEEEALVDGGALTVNKQSLITATAYVARVGKAFGENDLLGWEVGARPLDNLNARFASYWRRRLEVRAVATLKGAALGHAKDGTSANPMVLDISGLTGAAAHLSAEAIMDALALRGDLMYDFGKIIMSPAEATRLSKADLIDNIRDSEGRQIRQIGGREVILSELAGNFAFIVGQGALAFADGTPANVYVEETRDILKGEDIKTSRRVFALAPVGYTFVGDYTNQALTAAELATGSNWKIAANDAKNTGFVAIKINPSA